MQSMMAMQLPIFCLTLDVHFQNRGSSILSSIQRNQLLSRGLIAATLSSGCVFFGAYYYHNAILPKSDLGSDQAAHTYWGLMIYGDLVSRHWLSAFFDTYRQVYWPFLHSWLLAATYFCLGPTSQASRIASLIPFLVSGLVLANLAWHASKEAPQIAAIVAAGLWWTAGSFATFFGTEALLEPLAILLTVITFVAFRRALEGRSAASLVWCGLSVMCTYFAKTDYGLILLFAVVGAFLQLDVTQQEKRRILTAFGAPVVVLTGAWFLYLPKITATMRALINRPQGPDRWSIAGLLYHPQQLMRWSDEPWMFGLGVLCLALCISLRRDMFWKAVLIYVGISAVLHTISQTKDQKHIAQLLPWLFLCVAAQAANLYAWLEKRAHGRWPQTALVLLLAIAGWLRWSGVRRAVAPDESANLELVRTSIAEKAQEAGSSLIVGGFANLSPDVVRCSIMAREPGAILLPDRYKEPFIKRLQSLERRLPFLGLLEATARQGKTYEVLEMPLKLSGRDTNGDQILTDLLAKSTPETIFVVALDRNAPWRDEDYKDYVYDGDALLPFLNKSSSYSEQDDLHYQGFLGHIVVYKRIAETATRSMGNKIQTKVEVKHAS